MIIAQFSNQNLLFSIQEVKKMLKDSLPKIITELPGPKSKLVIEKRGTEIPSSIACATPCVIDRAEGAMVQDLDGNIFLDFVAGIGVLNIGHSNPEVIEAVQKQAERYFHPQINTFHYKEYVDLAEKLNTITPGDFKKRTAFFNSGSEAIDNVVKIARRYTKKPNVIAFTGAFHGRTYMAMTLTSSVKPYKQGFEPLNPGVYRVPYPYTYRAPEGVTGDKVSQYYLDQITDMFNDYLLPDTVAAIILEPIQGEGGFVVAPKEFVIALRELCTKHNILLIADEIQTGYCRTGKMFATDYWAEYGVYADLMTSAKSIAAGLPISAVTGREEIMEATLPGELGGTYGGNPLACASALKVLEIFERDNYAGKAMEMNKKLMSRFEKWYDQFDFIGEYRGVGAMAAIEFVKDRGTKEPNPELVNKIMAECKQKGLVVKNAGVYGQVIRFLAPLCITDAQLEAGLDILEDAMKKFTE